MAWPRLVEASGQPKQVKVSNRLGPWNLLPGSFGSPDLLDPSGLGVCGRTSCSPRPTLLDRVASAIPHPSPLRRRHTSCSQGSASPSGILLQQTQTTRHISSNVDTPPHLPYSRSTWPPLAPAPHGRPSPPPTPSHKTGSTGPPTTPPARQTRPRGPDRGPRRASTR